MEEEPEEDLKNTDLNENFIGKKIKDIGESLDLTNKKNQSAHN